MHFRLLAGAGLAMFLFATPAWAGQQHEMKAGCCDMPCCAGHNMKMATATAEPDAIGLLFAASQQVEPAAKPAVQASEVWFMRPTMVGRHILQGRYVIEHDNDRMARGEPCTYIYAYNDRTKPLITFDCKHLERGKAAQNTASLATVGTMEVLTEFQFAGDTAAHGVPIR